jgi:hypothetical protein
MYITTMEWHWAGQIARVAGIRLAVKVGQPNLT